MTRRRPPRESARERFARHVKARRLAMEISQEELAHRAGLHRTYVGAVERGERNLTVDNMERLANALDADIVSLLAP